MINQKNGTTKLSALHISLNDDFGVAVPIEAVDREQYVKAEVTVRGTGDTDDTKIASLPAEFIGYGCGSWNADPPKRNYGIKFREKQSLFQSPRSREWSLIACVWNNKDWAMLKSDSAYVLTRKVFRNLEYAARTQAVELYINGQYHGVYTLSERVLVEKGRVNIISNHGVLDTGYLLNYVWDGHIDRIPELACFKVENFKKSPPGLRGQNTDAGNFVIESPRVDDIGKKHNATAAGYAAQVSFIEAKTQKLTGALAALDYKRLQEIADIPSFVDNLIVQELYKNADYGSGGCYLYRKPGFEGGKFYAGPPWDFDWTVNGEPDGWFVTVGDYCPCPFATYSYAIPEFKEAVIQRWQAVSDEVKKFLKEFFGQYFDDPGYKNIFGRNFEYWDNREKEQAANSWLVDTENLRDWLLSRAEWFDEQWR